MHNVSRLLRNQRGLLFTTQTETEVLDFFNDHNESDFLRTGGIAGKSKLKYICIYILKNLYNL